MIALAEQSLADTLWILACLALYDSVRLVDHCMKGY